ncbi:MAG: methyltransferase domain-containing protein [Gemmatimonadetes bacterium]|nr:methyltransferase domain-containing protein [Gemmatimonadota bacterium]
MEPYRLHVYACEQKKAEGAPSCSANGSAQTIEALRREIQRQGLAGEVQVTACGSLGLCTRGPNMVVYPDCVWYSGVHPEDVEEIVRDHLAGGRPVERLSSGDEAAVRAEIDGNRKKMLAAFKAREDAGVLPEDLHQSINGFRDSRAILTAVELDLFTVLGGGGDAPGVAERLGADPRATEALLNALVAIGLLEKSQGTFTNGPVAARYFVEGAEHDSRAAIMHTVHLWPRWSTLTECVREGTSVKRARPDEWTEAFIAAMHKNAAFRAPMVVRAVDMDAVRRVLDLGGGSGAYSIAFAQAGEDVAAEVFDLASVLPITQRHIDEAGLTGRVTTRVGDLHDDDYGTGYDLVFLSAICHMNSPAENRAMLAKAFRALEPSGRVVIQDFILGPDKTGPKTGALFALNMLVGTRGGSSYSESEYAAWLEEAGFRDVRRVPLPGPTDLVIAQRP